MAWQTLHFYNLLHARGSCMSLVAGRGGGQKSFFYSPVCHVNPLVVSYQGAQSTSHHHPFSHYITFPGSKVSQNDCSMWNKSSMYAYLCLIETRHNISTAFLQMANDIAYWPPGSLIFITTSQLIKQMFDILWPCYKTYTLLLSSTISWPSGPFLLQRWAKYSHQPWKISFPLTST
jgi:hypothetical protein